VADIISQIGAKDKTTIKSKYPAGLRLYNQKYYIVRYDPEKSVVYLKKVELI
jgi:hypothetical protein